MKKFKGLGLFLLSFLIIAVVGSMVYGAAKSGTIPANGGNRSYYNIYDEDDMGSDSATGFPTQQSVKAYVDDPDDIITISSVTSYTLTPTGKKNTLIIDKDVGLASLTITLPTITEALKGYCLGIKQIDSGTTAATLTPTALTDTIESTLGTLTATTDATTDAIGDYKEFVVYYESGVSGYWLQKEANQT